MSGHVLCLIAALATAPPPDSLGVVDRWLALGAFPMIEGDARLAHDYLIGEGGEPNIEPDIGAAGQGLTWSPTRPDSAGFLRFARILMSGRRGNSFTYAHTYIQIPREARYRLLIDSANDVVAYLNGERVAVREADQPQRLRTDTIDARLAQGWNRLLIKLGNRDGPYLLRVTITDASGRPVRALQISAARPANLPWQFAPPAVDATSVSAGERLVIDADGKLWQPVTAAARQVTAGGRAYSPRSDSAGRAVFWVSARDLMADAASSGAAEAQAGDQRVRWSARDLLERLARPIFATDTRQADSTLRAARASDWLRGFRISYDANRERFLILNPGYPEARENLRWAAHFTGDSSAFRWTPEDDADLLRRLASDGASSYLAGVRAIEERVAEIGARLKPDTLWLVGHAHIDAAWLWPRGESEAVARNTLRSALRIGRLYPEFRFLQNSPAYLRWIETSDPPLFERIRDAVAAGRWSVAGGGWIEPDLNMSSGESLVRHQLMSQRYLESRFGRRAKLAWLLDVFGHPASFPQILRESGYERLVIHKVRWSDRNRFPHTAFSWEGADGSRIPTYVAYLYDHNMNGEWLARDYLEHKAATGASDQMILFGVSDHGGGPTLEMMDRARELGRLDAFPAIAHAPAEATLEKIFAETGASLPTWRGELYVETHRGAYTSQARIKRWNRRLESRLEAAEKLAALAWTKGLDYPKAELDSAWQVLLFNQFHDILAGSSIDTVYQDARRDYDAADRLLLDVIDRSLSHLAAEMDTRGSGRPVVVFNPLSWPRTGPVAIPRPQASEANPGVLDADVYRVRDAAGKSLPTAVRADSIAFLAEGIPSLGLAVFWIEPIETESGDRAESGKSGSMRTTGRSTDASRFTLENDFVQARINPSTGNLASLVDKRQGRELIVPGQDANRLVVLRDSVAFWEAWNLGWTGESWEVDSVLEVKDVSDGDLRRGVQVRRAWGASRFQQTYWLYAGAVGLVIESEVDWQESRMMLKAAFPLEALGDTVWAEIPYGAVGRPALPVTAIDSAKFEAPMQRWLSVSADGAGVTIANDSHHGYDVSDGAVRISLLRAPRWPDPNADRGRHRFSYAIYPHDGDWRAAAAWRHGAELNVPPLARWEPAHAGARGHESAWAELDAPSVAVTALKRNEAGDGLALRLVEHSGEKPTMVRVVWNGGIARARAANLLEDERGELPSDSRLFSIELRPFQIGTVLIEPTVRSAGEP